MGKERDAAAALRLWRDFGIFFVSFGLLTGAAIAFFATIAAALAAFVV